MAVLRLDRKRMETMKRFLLMLLAVWGFLEIQTAVQAQNLVIGSRVSEVKISEYLLAMDNCNGNGSIAKT